MNITTTLPKPRNHLAALARRRRAGSHRPGATSQRQQAHRALKRELDRMKHSP